MITTAHDMFLGFLDGIKKERISTVTPDYFNRIINEAYDIWYKQKSVEIERDQKRIDDLQGLRVVTDGVFKYNSVILPVIPAVNQDNTITWGRNIFMLPISGTVGNVIINGVSYPRYRRFLNVMFKVRYYGDPCYPDGTISDWKDAYIMRSNQRSIIKKNPFRRPSKNKLYYEIIDNLTRIDTGGTSIGYEMRIEYIKYPANIAYIHGGTSVNCELQSDQQREIVDIAIRQYIERVSDPRYQTQMYEQAQKSVGN